ncbi:hypothetical protein DF286_01385 [Sphingosinicella humi]|uniref:DUF6265 domain-containing protein n=2 Tax=Allosphingosinicella humi TaxID=2068657 RepID=A0A2U2J606_9SPHN|nr:hypothetical protein DF286_01385 [Sphingosinicella humi]
MALAALLSLAAAPAVEVGDLQWLSGSWVSRDGDRWTEEWWTPPRGGIMIGAGFSGRGAKATSFEHMRIMAGEDGAIAFYGMPGGAATVRFPLVNGGEGEAVFENPAHDYPQRIRYRLEGETLVATTSLMDGSREQRWIYRRME